MTRTGPWEVVSTCSRVVVDTDGGIDDLVALWFLATAAEVELCAVIATGIGRPAVVVARNVGMLLKSLGRDDVPVVLGADRPTGTAPRVEPAPLHGAEGIGALRPWTTPGPPSTAGPAELLSALGHDAPVHLVTLGPLSTVAGLLPVASAREAVGGLTIMGGAIRTGGNALPAAEANIARDPRAAARVLAHPWSVPTRIVCLDATLRATLGPAELALFGPGIPAGEILRALLDHYRAYSPDPEHFACHDLFASVVSVQPEVAHFERAPITVDCGESAAWGMTVADPRPPGSARPPGTRWRAWEIATGADTTGFRSVVARAAENAGRPHFRCLP